MKPLSVAVLLLLAGFALPPAAQDPLRLLEEYETEITVYGTRLSSEESKIIESPLHVSVITREQIETSGASTLQELLESLPGFVLHNITGNPVESQADLRGFPQGTSLAVFLDGVRLNTLEDGGMRWDILPLEDIERIEVYRGAAAPLYGGGALSGVVNVITGSGSGIPRLDLKVLRGSHNTWEQRIHASGSLGDFEVYGTAMRRASRGYRENDGYRLDDGLLRVAYKPDDDREVALFLKYHGGALSNPGALTEEEMEEDRRQSPFNLYDGTRGRHRIASLKGRRRIGDNLHLSALLFTRLHDRDTLTTGRYGTGFSTTFSERLSGLSMEADASGDSGSWGWRTGIGAEASQGKVAADGYYTDLFGNNPFPASSTATRQRPYALFFHGGLSRGPADFSVGVRYDGVRYRYENRFAPKNNVERTFQESTLRASFILHTSAESSAFLTYAEGFRIPTVQELFAYPGFFSNPDLEPTTVRDWEAGWRYFHNGVRLQITLFKMKLKNEVVYVLTDLGLFIGRNENVGRSIREGLELEGRFAVSDKVTLFASGNLLKAEITAGPNAGSRIPMVPEKGFTGGIELRGNAWSGRLSGTYVGSQRLDNDPGNHRANLPSYFTVDLSGRYSWRGLTVEGSLRNLLDRNYASRGITNGWTDYYTPAYPRTVRLGVTWSF